MLTLSPYFYLNKSVFGILKLKFGAKRVELPFHIFIFDKINKFWIQSLAQAQLIWVFGDLIESFASLTSA